MGRHVVDARASNPHFTVVGKAVSVLIAGSDHRKLCSPRVVVSNGGGSADQAAVAQVTQDLTHRRRRLGHVVVLGVRELTELLDLAAGNRLSIELTEIAVNSNAHAVAGSVGLVLEDAVRREGVGNDTDVELFANLPLERRRMRLAVRALSTRHVEGRASARTSEEPLALHDVDERDRLDHPGLHASASAASPTPIGENRGLRAPSRSSAGSP